MDFVAVAVVAVGMIYYRGICVATGRGVVVVVVVAVSPKCNQTSAYMHAAFTWRDNSRKIASHISCTRVYHSIIR